MTIKRDVRALLFSIALSLGQLSFSSISAAAERELSDEFLAGYLTSIIEREFGWPRDSFRVDVRQGAAEIVVSGDDAAARAAA